MNQAQLQRQQHYIRQHNLAVIVDALLQDVAIAKPDDPYTFLAEKIAAIRHEKAHQQTSAIHSTPKR